jgi:hypothetical protein
MNSELSEKRKDEPLCTNCYFGIRLAKKDGEHYCTERDEYHPWHFSCLQWKDRDGEV